jgi:hypothetical protein
MHFFQSSLTAVGSLQFAPFLNAQLSSLALKLKDFTDMGPLNIFSINLINFIKNKCLQSRMITELHN